MIRLQQTVLLLSIALVGACAAPSTTTNHNCPGANPGIVPINVNFIGPTINVEPDSQTANEGDVLRFNLVGADNVLVSTSGKTPDAGWLNSSGKRKPGKAASYQFYVCVPTDLFPDEAKSGDEKDFEYNVNAVGKPQLDPKVRIIRN
jgi:hypothetical protein